MSKIEFDYSILESCELFAGIPSSIQMDVMASANTRSFLRREVMFFTGDPIVKVLLLVEGCVKITQLSEKGNEVILRLHGPGEIVGMPDWMPGDVHSSTAQTLQASRVLVWEAQAFQSAKERFPQLQRNVNEIIERTLNRLERRYCQVSTATAAPRLAHGLVHMVEQVGHKVNGHFELSISQEELGQITAVSTFEVSRVLGRWEREGLVRLRREVIEVRSIPRLLSVCGK